MVLSIMNRLEKYLNNNILVNDILKSDEVKKVQSNEDGLVDLYYLYKKYGKKMCNRLNILEELQKKLHYTATDFIEDFDFNFDIIRKRMIKYSEGLICKDFPFDSYNYFIAGGFVLNSIIGVNSRYTDIDIYIYHNFEESVEKLIDYFENVANVNIKMTYSKSIINIYPIGYNINIQIINFVGLTPEQIITNFDMSYSQMGLFNWNDDKKKTIEMTFLAYQTLTTGLFNLNRNAIIRNYRIIKGYVKGFILDPDEFYKLHNNTNNNNNNNNNNEYQYNLLNEVKKLIGILARTPKIGIEKLLIEHLTNGNNINDYKLMTKSVFIEYDDIGEKELEQLTGCKYFDFNKFNPNDFEPLKFYINYDCYLDNDDDEDDENTFPEMKTINILGNGNIKLIVDVGDYYKNYRELKSFKINLRCNVSDLRLLNVILTNETENALLFIVPFTINEKIKSFLGNLDARIQKIIDTNHLKIKHRKIIQNDTQGHFKIIVGMASFIKNIIHKNQLTNNVNTYNITFNKLKKDIKEKLNIKKIKEEGITLDIIEDCNIDINDKLTLQISIDGIIHNKSKDEYLCNLKTIINLD